jgi:hypothetical protein
MKKVNSILLLVFIILAVVLNFLPHLNYSLPLHVDEWVHFQYSNYISDDAPTYYGEEVYSLEAGFHLLLAVLSSVGIPYVFMFTFFASFMTILICLGVFILTRKLYNETAAVFAVLFIALLKSTVMILGPSFFVPMALGMFFIVIGLYLIKSGSNLWFLILASLLIMHPPTAMAFLLLINIEFLIKRKNYFKNIKLQLLAGLIALPLYIETFTSRGFESINRLEFLAISDTLFIPVFLGWALVTFAVIGIYFSMDSKKYSIPFYILGLLFFIFIFYQYKIEIFIPYRRALMYLFLILSVSFGFGVERIINLFKTKKLKVIVGLLIILLVVILTLPGKIDSNKYFYHIINEEEYGDFVWIKENTAEDSLVVLDPWKADAFTPIAERKVYTRIQQGPDELAGIRNTEVYAFFGEGCNDLDFITDNDIDLIYGSCDNSELEEIYNNVWIINVH